MVSNKVLLLGLLMSLSCLCVANALDGDIITPQRGGPCSYDNLCHNHCPGCKFTQCVNGKCVCTDCYTPPAYSGLEKAKALEEEENVIRPNRGGLCTNDNICYPHCPSCTVRKCVDGQCVCTGCNIPPIRFEG
ncbi:hypothetical protein AALP_AA8G212100 [Arabis alpina]|uniref:Antistasin-like domain-containing protein n=1 Tax=Arabis alpina TaxID=50452 RepID=A0A087G8G9_ARAAL|nr:hypothetical protein AALP_AA8G212100 [Arabis alpina]